MFRPVRVHECVYTSEVCRDLLAYMSFVLAIVVCVFNGGSCCHAGDWLGHKWTLHICAWRPCSGLVWLHKRLPRFLSSFDSVVNRSACPPLGSDAAHVFFL